MMDPSHQPGMAAAHHHDPNTGKEDGWVNYSDLDKSFFTVLLTAFSLSTSLIAHPLTVLTVRQQASSSLIQDSRQLHQSNANILKGIQMSMGQLGVRGLFRGWFPIATMGIPSDVKYYSVIEHSRESIQNQARQWYPAMSAMTMDFIQAALSSSVACFVSRIPYVPAEVVSTRLIVQDRGGLGTIGMTKAIYSESGLRGFYAGFFSSYSVGVVNSTIWWWTYSTCRRYAAAEGYAAEYPVASDAIAGLISGCVGLVLSHPFDTIKTRVMTAKKVQGGPTTSFTSELLSLLKREGFGLRVLFRGLPASLYQTALGSTFFAASYELIKVTSTNN